ncbi:sigma-70 family RNA polymerase sigma factor [Kribbella sandramycini]|uniref:RNA polymerase sigma-B factor n=2 Tax=Kribbella sandramycini TaxID=60450 RepID=A0A7Y4KZH8_9ACTN|nr:sigma-70 family RNA polymerase sigma factor [Kribbella sandramycini]MBB6569635.1 RNA polymerase sigma-B factor [Kribbella sandramycini]NOL40531.1 sigma-70 family RNA polymerase sigma factor [Kribbella sandramycini]
MTRPLTSASETMERLFRSAAEVDGPPRQELLSEAVEAGVPLAQTLARRYRGRGVDHEDLDQVAYEYLVRAAHNYRPTEGSDFRSYAVPTIRGGIRHHFRDHAWAVKLPRRLQELQARVNTAHAELTAVLHREPTVHELADQIGVGADDVIEADRARGCFQPSSLDAPLFVESPNARLQDRLPDPADTYALVDQIESLQRAVAGLPAREQLILRRRFSEHRTQAEIGAEIRLSQMQVSRLLGNIIARLQQALMPSG